MKRAGERANRRTWGAAAWVLMGALALGGCAGESGEVDPLDSTQAGGSSVESTRCPTGAAGSPAADIGTEAPPDRDCTVVDDDGQPVCKLKSGRVCATNDACASGVCKTIVVPPNPHDPYDLGYSYDGCE